MMVYVQYTQGHKIDKILILIHDIVYDDTIFILLPREYSLNI